jgi:hypothetical protein
MADGTYTPDWARKALRISAGIRIIASGRCIEYKKFPTQSYSILRFILQAGLLRFDFLG